MRRWSIGTAVTVLAAGLAGAVVAKVVIDGVVKLSQERRRTIEGMLTTMQSTVAGIVNPEPAMGSAFGVAQAGTVLFNHEGARKVQLPDGSTAVVTPPEQPTGLRPAWAGGSSPLPVELGGDLEDGWGEDPTNLQAPLDHIPDDWNAAGRLHALYPDPAPEAEALQGDPSRVATFSPGENPLADIGITPAWQEPTTNGDAP